MTSNLVSQILKEKFVSTIKLTWDNMTSNLVFSDTEKTISKMNKKKTPSPDCLIVEIISELFVSNKNPTYIYILYKCLKKGLFAKQWKEGNDKSIPGSYNLQSWEV